MTLRPVVNADLACERDGENVLGPFLRSITGTIVPPVSTREAEHAARAIEPRSKIAVLEFRANQFQKLQESLAAHQIAKVRADHLQKTFAAVEGAHMHAPAGTWIKALIVALSGVACFVAEFQITWDALPFLLNIPKRTAGGVALGLTVPIIATTILHLVIDRLFETPWRATASASCSIWHRRVATVAMCALMATLGAGTLYTIYLVGVDRGEAIRAHQSLEQLIEGGGNGEVSLSEAGTTRSFVAVGILLAMAGAVAFLVATVEFRQAIVRARLWLRLAVLRRRVLAAIEGQHRAAAAVETSRHDWDHVEEHARWLGDLDAAHSRLELERASQQPPTPKPSNLGIVETMLARRGA